MHKNRWLVIPFLMIFAMGCGLISGVQGLQNAATTALPAVETSAPTEQGMLETMAAGQTGSSTCPSTPTAGGLGISIDTAKTVLPITQQFAFTDGNVGGQPAAIVTLTPSGASSFPAIAQGFTAQFIGDPCNLSQISITIPRTDQQDSADQGVNVLSLVLTGTLPIDVQLAFFTWVTQNYPAVPVSGQQQTTIKTFQFNLQRNQTSMVLDIVPTK
jgi:hypothetical protein